MAFDEGLAQRLREALADDVGLVADAELAAWARAGISFVRSLPMKR